jgi:hypothetical protein
MTRWIRRLTMEDVEGTVAEVVPLPDRGEQPSLEQGTGTLHAQVVHSDGRRSSEG